ncbi:unnamed protein product [Onchocerca flexuosa]|uniref:DDE_Tnp_1_7 domain-containing protein n=1 Tax=Onchocerca flexuosa TaxID=387005 RepID=A0A183HHG0_9BILA|nr:unnamed protein product [Onchocerca flexuosa]
MGSCELKNADFVEPDTEFAEDDLFSLDDVSEANLNSKFLLQRKSCISLRLKQECQKSERKTSYIKMI